MDKIEQIIQCIDNAEQHKSKLNEYVLGIGGFTSTKIRHLLNNLGGISKVYCEIGCLRGSTLLSTIYENKNLERITAIDNFSELEDGTVERELRFNINRFSENHNGVLFIKEDCFNFPYEYTAVRLFDLFFYDGNHNYFSQKKAITHFYQYFSDECIVCVDDADWQDVYNGTQDGIKECNLEILYERHLTTGKEGDADGWWNGFYVALLKKKT